MDLTTKQEQDTCLIRMDRVKKTYTLPVGSFTALNDISFDVRRGEFLAVVGKSGSGKSTLLNMISGIDSPSSGEIYVASKAIHALTQEQLAVWRGRSVGIVFQFFQLLPTLTVAENVMLPMDFCKTYPARERHDRAFSLLDKLGISDQGNKLPSSLSGGQQQRAAIARALANDPPLLVADEPTGNLDSQSSEELLGIFSGLIKEGKTIVMVTHETRLMRYFSRTVVMQDGNLLSEATS